ncbi:hypothetical protein D9613_009332 [Agrocybe pediades]|uniref:ATP-grasp domain-containing protein n=1 Tax=Agrocybe pediades TaxID=84607 RepID=A0A8H4VW35_9AGAR|nr:hypothetical protein D9613_009332 [Agrocybe pediades]
MPSNDSHIASPLKIGFTYDLRSEWIAAGLTPDQCQEFEDIEYIERMAAALRKLGSVDMIGGAKALTKRLASGNSGWDVVFNYCEGYGTVAREAQVPALLEAWGITTTLSDSATMALCQDKGRTKMVLEHYGIPTAPFACIPPRCSWDASSYYPLSLLQQCRHREALATFPLFVKPASASTGIGIDSTNKVRNHDELANILDCMSKKYPDQSILVESFLEGREFTVGIIGTGRDARVIGISEFIFHGDLDVYGYASKCYDSPDPTRHFLQMSSPVAQDVAKVALDAWKILGCRDGGRIDIRHDTKGSMAKPMFIEVNPIPGLKGPDFSDLPWLANENGISYDNLIASIVHSALKRKDNL